jgi:hypothetical protein
MSIISSKVCHTCRYSLQINSETYICINNHGPKLSDYVTEKDSCSKWEGEKEKRK